MAISTNGTIIARLAGGLYNTVLSNATYLEVVAQDPSALANKLYAADFGKKTDAEVGTILVTNLGLASLTGLDAWVAAQLTAAGANKGAKVVELLNGFAQMTADTTYGTYATAFNAKVDAALAASQKDGNAESKFETAGVTAPVTSFTLTTSVDTIVGSAGDDTITAPATVATTGAAQTTINSGDSIDGGAGNDTLTLTITGANNTSLTGLTIKGVEKISYVGSDNLGGGAVAYAAAVADKAVTAAALKAAVAAKVAADTAYTTAKGAAAAAAYIGSLTTFDAVKDKVTNGASGSYSITVNGTATSTAYTAAQAKAAASAALKAIDGTALSADDTVTARADVLVASTQAASNAAETVAAASSTTGSAAEAESKAYLADAKAAATLAGAKAAITTASIAANADATSITVDGINTNVTGLKDTQTVTFSGADGAAAKLTYASTATVANLATSGASGTFTLADASSSTATKGVVTANVTGSVAVGTAATSTTNAVAGTLTLVDSLNTAGTVKTLNLGLTSDAKVGTSGMAKLTSIDASTSTGGVELTSSFASSSDVVNIKTGAGKDKVTFDVVTSATVATKLTASLDTGAGNDTITVSNTGAGTATVNAGAGDDTITLSALGTATVDGGEGTDTLVVGTNTTFSAGNYNSIKGNVSNVEKLELNNAAATTIDASKVAQFTSIGFTTADLSLANVVTKVADAQTVVLKGTDASVFANGYTAKFLNNADGDQVTATAYAGALTINASGGSSSNKVDITANASSVTVNVAALNTPSDNKNEASFVTLTGDVKTATINISNALNNTKTASSDVANTFSMTVGSSSNSGTSSTPGTLGGGLNTLGNLTAVTLVGSGNVSIDNSNSGTATKLKTVDASALGGAYTIATTSAKVGDPLGGLTYSANLAVVEAITLGAGKDTITAASSYAKMDTITGFTLVGNLDDSLNTTKSDDIVTGSSTTFVKKTTGLSGSLDANLTTVGALSDANVVFQNGGNTYIYRDINTSDTTDTSVAGLDDGDQVIELIGLVNLDLLILALNS